MWLIDTSTFTLTRFSSSSKCPPYAILSHTWGLEADEVSFQEMILNVLSPSTAEKSGYKKIVETCKLSRTLYSLKYVWVDTCCIDKTSSAELSEAINSMFTWYEQSRVCFAFLSDLLPDSQSLENCVWFTRGWTLQELIAPTEVIFLDKSWANRGSRRVLIHEIARVSGVATGVLDRTLALAEIPVAVRMSWAAQRETTREEDLAYCLLGIFDINMPMLYGEGRKAFLRLQEEIIRQNPDLSIFAWTALPKSGVNYSGLLAQEPAEFKDARNLISPQEERNVLEFSITNQGIRIHAPMGWDKHKGHFILPVNLAHSGLKVPKGVYLRQVATNLFVRALPGILASGSECLHGMLQSLQIIKTLMPHHAAAIDRNVIGICMPAFPISKIEPTGSWDPSRSIFFAGHMGEFVGYIHFIPEWADEYDSCIFVCHFKSSWSISPWQFHLICGDDWKDIEPKFPVYYRQHDDESVNIGALGRSLVLPHLYKESLEMVVTINIAPTAVNAAEITWLAMEVEQRR
jgi:hypothetical protein